MSQKPEIPNDHSEKSIYDNSSPKKGSPTSVFNEVARMIFGGVVTGNESEEAQSIARQVAGQIDHQYDSLMADIKTARGIATPGLSGKAFLLPGTTAIGHESDIGRTLPDGSKTNPMPNSPNPAQIDASSTKTDLSIPTQLDTKQIDSRA